MVAKNEYFFGKKRRNKLIEKVHNKVLGKKQNLVLIGMPGCGKTTLGTKLAKSFGREFIDTDALIVEKEGVDIPTIFETKSELVTSITKDATTIPNLSFNSL